ncbi:hypothetical protein H2200_004768 [Cladophialophora chaetospira]|uniref:F-box domain-containing protein n=1 Tax=Cladophialophora chaetospira TaxID=386627 RepID=A0AA39CKR9_9EURO|nr:hypothetical protein H2200_004768 [Cladophialophora chaetospira]
MQLPEEILRQIFCHIDSHDVDQKFRLSQVCSQWRTVAIGQRLLWNRLRIMTPLDGQRLPLILERSGSAALDVELLWVYRHKEPMLTPEERKLAATQLAGCLKWLRRLFIDIGRAEPKVSSALMAKGLSFPNLEDLEVQSSLSRTQKFDLSLSAPQLQRLVLYEMGKVDWQSLLAKSLTHLSLIQCWNAELTLLDTILQQCPELRALTLRQFPFASEFPGLKIPAVQLVPHLRFLDLRADAVDLSTTLRTGFRGLPLDELTTEMYNGFVDDETKQLISDVLDVQAMESLYSLQSIDDQEIVIRDRTDRAARMKVWNEDGHWSWPDIWEELAAQHGGRHSMKKFRIRSHDWNVLAGAFNACPPLADSIEIHIDLNSDDIIDQYDFEYDDTPVSELEKAEKGLRYMRCSTLRKIVFADHEHWSGNSSCSRVEVVIQLLKAVQTASATVEVCLTDAGLRWDTDSDDELCDTIGNVLMRDERYILCHHCRTVLEDAGLTGMTSFFKLSQTFWI